MATPSNSRCEPGGNASEERAQLGAQSGRTHRDAQSDQGGEQSIFNGGGTTFIADEFIQLNGDFLHDKHSW